MDFNCVFGQMFMELMEYLHESLWLEYRPFATPFFLTDFIFQSSFQFTAKLDRS